MSKRLVFSSALLAFAGVVGMLAHEPTVEVSGAVPVESTRTPGIRRDPL